MVRSMEFARDGHRIVVRNAAGLSTIDLRNGAATDLKLAELHAFTTIADQIWAVAGAPATLTVFDPQGRVLGAVPVPAPGDRPYLLRATGPRIAAWVGARVTIIAHDGAVTATELASDVELALPLSSTRTLVSSRQRLTLREQDTARWTVPLAALGTVSDAALVLDGKAVAITASSATSQVIAVLGLRDGAILHRITVGPRDAIRLAPARGVALAHSGDSRLVVIDLRFGRVIVDYDGNRPIAEAAIDDSGRDVALRLVQQPGEVVHVTVADLLRAAASVPAARPVAEAATADDAPEPATAAPADDQAPATGDHGATPEAAPDPFSAGGLSLACDALPPRPALEPTTAAETLLLHTHHRELAIAMVGVAIARAWDEGRLAFAQSAGLPFQSEVSGVTSGQRGLALDELASARARLEDIAGAALEARRSVAPRLPPLDRLGTELGLSAIARDLLLLVAAPSLWGEMARLYGILSNDDGRPLIDEHLLTELLVEQADPAQIARELDDDAPLIRHGVVRVLPGTMRPFLPLVADPVVLKLLRGAAIETELEPLIHPRAADRTFDELRIPTAVKRRLVADLADLAHAPRPLRIAIRGRVGSGRHTLLAAVAAASGRQLGAIDATSIVRDARVRVHELAVALDRAHLAGLVPCVDGLELIASHDVVTRDQVRDVLRRHAGPLAVRLPLDAQPPLDPGHVLIDLPALSLTDRLACWERTLARHELRVVELGELGDRYAIGPGVIERVAAEVARTRDAEPDAGPRLEAGIRQHLEARLGTSANRVARLATWEQVILPSDIQDSLTELIARIKHRRIVFDRWGFDRLMSTSRGVTALFQGGPGTGKTLVASAIANELGMDLYRVDLSRVMSKWIGETEQNLAKLFDAAEDGNSIILFDEADSLFAKRTEVKSSGDRYANLEVNYLLQRIDSFEGIAILTTNFGTSIDSAFKRRLSLRLTFPFPDEDIREKLWRAHLPAELPVAGRIDLAEIARRYQMSGGYIRNVALRAAFLAAEEHSPLTQDHLERAIKAEFREIGKIADSGVLE
jgi:ATPase family protein associated with various cellular activities (AAA)/winged helix domain-containing protein